MPGAFRGARNLSRSFLASWNAHDVARVFPVAPVPSLNRSTNLSESLLLPLSLCPPRGSFVPPPFRSRSLDLDKRGALLPETENSVADGRRVNRATVEAVAARVLPTCPLGPCGTCAKGLLRRTPAESASPSCLPSARPSHFHGPISPAARYSNSCRSPRAAAVPDPLAANSPRSRGRGPSSVN